MRTKEFTFQNEDGEEEVLELPVKMEICYDCSGHGTTMIAGMRNYAYSQEEFDREFDDEEQEAYFNGGYDETCHTCKGEKVLPEVDEANIPSNLKEQYALLKAHQEEMERLEAADAAYSRMERMMGC